jgi:hypothetical protein
MSTTKKRLTKIPSEFELELVQAIREWRSHDDGRITSGYAYELGKHLAVFIKDRTLALVTDQRL